MKIFPVKPESAKEFYWLPSEHSNTQYTFVRLNRLTPRLIRPKRASSVRVSEALERFLDACSNEWLRNKVQEAFSQLKNDFALGDKVTKDHWPRYYAKQWGVNNLYVYDLGPDWRLTYTFVYDGVGTGLVALEVLTHKEYDKRFGYRTT